MLLWSLCVMVFFFFHSLSDLQMSQHIRMVFHHQGRFTRDPNNKLQYVDGLVERMPRLDIDYINLFDIQNFFKDMGYDMYKNCRWLKLDSKDLDIGLRLLNGDANINEMCRCGVLAGKGKGENEVHLYFEHPMHEPIEVDVNDKISDPADAVANEEWVRRLIWSMKGWVKRL